MNRPTDQHGPPFERSQVAGIRQIFALPDRYGRDRGRGLRLPRPGEVPRCDRLLERASRRASRGRTGARPPDEQAEGALERDGEGDEDERKTIGFRIVPVLPQTEPIRLELNGTTDYDQNTLNKVRPRFDNALVEKVFVSAGQSVKKGDPLLELQSAELGAAKNECRTKFVQWDHDHKYLVAREPLAKEGRITQIIWTDTQNDEKKSRLDYFVARDKLATYGMTNEQIDKLLEGLSDDRKKALEADDDTQDITRMTVLSPIDGMVVERDARPGQLLRPDQHHADASRR